MRVFQSLPFNVWLFTLIQALAMSAGAMMVMVGGLIGAELAPRTDLATLPVAAMIVGTALGVVPVTQLMGRVGRKPVFIGCALLAAAASVLAAWTTYAKEFYPFLLAVLLLGVAVSAFQQIRFAAMESVAPAKMPKAASTVMLGGLAAAILGPELVTWGKDLMSWPYGGSFVLMALVAMACAILFGLTRPLQTVAEQDSPQQQDIRLGGVLKSPLFIVAVSSSVIGYALMSFIMTATPVHMHVLESHSLEHTKWVIQSHILAMFLPSFISGWLISKLGVYKVIVSGLVIYLMTIFMALSGDHLLNYWASLVLLGVGWNFLFLGGTVLLPSTHSSAQKFKVQSVHEFMVFSAQGAAALGAGFMLYQFGWQGLLLFSLSIVFGHVCLLLWQYYRIHSSPSMETNK